MHPRGRLRAQLIVFAAAAALGVGARGQAPAAPDGLLAEIGRRLEAIERCAATLSITVEVEVAELDGESLDPPGRSSVEWKTRRGRVLAGVRGLDLDGIREKGVDSDRTRLLLPGGLTESFDAGTGAFSRDQRSYVQAASVASDLGPGELLWSFCGSARSAILSRRGARVERISGTPGSRTVEVASEDRAGVQRITFACAEEWGFLPRACAMLARSGDHWVELRRVEIGSVRRERLGFMPETATLVAFRPGSAPAAGFEGLRRTRLSYRLGRFEPAGVEVPASLPAAPVAGQDDLFGSRSHLFREPIAGRGDELNAMLGAIGGLSRGPMPGRRDWAPWGLGGAAGAGALLGCAALRRGRRWCALAASAGCAGALAIIAAGRFEASSGDASAPAFQRGAALVAAPPAPAKALCGADCLYAAADALGETQLDYARLVKLIRPGAQGTTLDTLRIVAECLDLGPEPVDPRSFAAPPHPLIAHVRPGHFVVVASLAGGGVAVIDPGRGAFRARWEDVRPALSAAGLAFRGRARS